MRGRLILPAALVAWVAATPAPRSPAPAAASLAPPVPRVKWIEQRATARDTTGLVKALLTDRALNTRAAAARALGLVQERSTVPGLVRALGDRSATVRREAAFALGLMGDTTIVAAIAQRQEKEIDLGARETMVNALGLLGAQAGAPAVSRALGSKREPERWTAALAAARIRARSLITPLTAAAEDPRPEMRWRVAYALGRIGDAAGAPALRNLARDKTELARMSAARGIADVKDSVSAPLLASMLRDTSWKVRVNAAHALGMLGARGQLAAVRPLLADPSAHVRWEAALVLGVLADTASVPALARALADSSSGVVQGAAISLLKLQGERAIPTIAPQLDLLPGFLRSGLLEALGTVPGPMSLEILLSRARDESDPAEAAGAVAGLVARHADSTKVVALLRGLLNARDFTVVSNAADGLGQMGDSASAPLLARLLTRQGTTEDADLRASAVSGLAALKTPESLAALATARRDPERRIREAVCAALGLPPDSVGLVKNPLLRAPAASPIPRTAVLQTERGLVTIAFDVARAPVTVLNFVSLARSKYFDGIAFHRVVPNFVVQDGCPRGDGWGGPGYEIPCEYNDRPYETGTVGMALGGKDTGGSQWFVTLSPQPRLEGRYTVFGTVTRGMDVFERMMPGDRILKVTLK